MLAAVKILGLVAFAHLLICDERGNKQNHAGFRNASTEQVSKMPSSASSANGAIWPRKKSLAGIPIHIIIELLKSALNKKLQIRIAAAAIGMASLLLAADASAQLPTLSISLANGRTETTVTEGTVIAVKITSSRPVTPLAGGGFFKARVVPGGTAKMGSDIRAFPKAADELLWISKGRKSSALHPIIINRDKLVEGTERLILQLERRDKIYRINPKAARVTINIRNSARSSVSAATLRVPTDTMSIRHALLAVQSDDTISVGPGTYYENDLRFSGKNVTLRGTRQDGQLATTIDAQRKACHFNIGGGESRRLVIRDFRLINGSGAGLFNGVRKVNMAGSIHITSGSSPTILGNLIMSNKTAFEEIILIDPVTKFQTRGQSGGAIFVAESSINATNPAKPISNPLIRGNTFIANAASANGAAVAVLDANVQLENNVFRDNKANLSGGAVHILSPRRGPTLIVANTFVSNRAFGLGDVKNSGGGGAIALSCGSQQPAGISTLSTISGNIFLSNTCRFAGGAIGVFGADVDILSNTITGNNGGEYGGGIHIETQAKSGGTRQFRIEGNTINSNQCRYVGGGIHPFFEDTASIATIRSNTIVGNQAIHPTATLATVPADDKSTGGGNIGRGGGVGSLGGVGFLHIIANDISRNRSQQEGAIWITESPTAIEGNTIKENVADFRNGGLFVNQSPVMLIKSNLIASNTVGTDWGQLMDAESSNLDTDRAPLYIAGLIPTNGSSTQVTIQGNTFARNAGYKAGAIFLMRSPNASISENSFNQNETTHAQPNAGGTIFNDRQAVRLVANTFDGDRWAVFNQGATSGMVITGNKFRRQELGVYRAPGFGSASSGVQVNAGISSNHPSGTFAGNVDLQ